MTDKLNNSISNYLTVCVEEGHRPSLKHFVNLYVVDIRFSIPIEHATELITRRFKDEVNQLGLDADMEVKDIDWTILSSTPKRHAEVNAVLDEWEVERNAGDNLWIDEVNVNEAFYQYQVQSLEGFRTTKTLTWGESLQALLSLSSIIFLDGPYGRLPYLTESQYRQLYGYLLDQTGPYTPLPQDIILADSIQQYKQDRKFWKLSKNLNPFVEKYEDDEGVDAVLQAVLTMAPNLNAFPSSKSEMHISCDFIHNFINGVFKLDPSYSPHCSNVIGAFHNTRPDCRVDAWKDSFAKYTNVFGEEATEDGIIKEIYRIAILSKVAIDEHNLNAVLTFRSVDSKIYFYLTKKHNSMYFFYLMYECTIPTSIAMFDTIIGSLNSMYNLRRIYHDHCGKNGTEDIFEIPKTLPWNAVESLIETTKSNKRSTKTRKTYTEAGSSKNHQL